MQAILESLPLAPWMTVDTTPLSPHPSDPAIICLLMLGMLPVSRGTVPGASPDHCSQQGRELIPSWVR